MLSSTIESYKKPIMPPIVKGEHLGSNASSGSSPYIPSAFDLALVFGSCIDFPLSILSSIAAGCIKNPEKPINLGSEYANLFLRFVANLYPLALIFSSFLGLMQGFISASPMRILTYLLVCPSILFGIAPAEFKSITIGNDIGFLKDNKMEKDHKAKMNDLYKQLQDTNAFLNFFTKSPYILFLILTFVSHFSDVSPDHPNGTNYMAKPIIPGKIKNFKDYFQLLKSNAKKEWMAFTTAFEIFDPKKARGTLFGQNPKVEEEIIKRNYTGFKANFMRLSACSLKSLTSYSVCSLRLVSAGIFAYIASQVGLRIFNQNSNLFTPEDKKKIDQNPNIQNLYNFANNIYSLSALCGGMTTILSLSPGYLQTSGKSAAFVKMGAGGLLVLTALSNFMQLPDIISRSIFYAAGPTYLWSHALRIIHRTREYFKTHKGLTSTRRGF